jgi:benzil reductase ((S)-benzoin forming)
MNAAIVTGVSRGLGEAIAATLLARGYHVIGVGRGSAARLSGAGYEFVACDLARPTEACATLATSFASLAARRPERVCLVNNAASAEPVGLIGSLGAPAIGESLVVNLAAPTMLADLFCKVFASDAMHRRIINVSSGAASSTLPGAALYCVAKAGIEMLTRCLAAEPHGDNFRAITVRPGVIDTGMQVFMRGQSRERLPGVAMFEGFHSSGQLVPPDTTADVIARTLIEAPVENGKTYTYQELAG